MDKSDFINILQLAAADVRVVDPEVIGVGLMVMRLNRRGDIEIQIGSDMAESVVLGALGELLHRKA